MVEMMQISVLIWVMFAASLVPCMLSIRFEGDQKNYYSPPHDPHAGTPPTGHHGSTPSHGSGGSPHGTPSHGSYNPTPSTPSTPSNCENPPTPSTPSNPPSGGGGYPSPPTYGGGGSPPVTVSPPISTDPGTPTCPGIPTPTCPSPHHGSTPSHGSGGSSHGTPSHGSYNPTPSTPSNCGNPPTPSTPSNPPSGGGGCPSPPTYGGGGSPPVTVSPPISTDPGTPTYPGIPTPAFPGTNPPGTGTCNYWSTHPGVILGILGWWGTLGNAFGVSSLPGFGSNLSLQQALSNTRSDGLGALYREGTAAWLNSMVNNRFPFTTNQVRQNFVGALRSDTSAATQARLFKLANEGHLKPRP